jgi:glycosyltransferase involved in cell wall biosynthesis
MFDPMYAPAYAEDSDLAFKVREAGKQVWYQPLSTVVHFEGTTCGTDLDCGVKFYQVANVQKLNNRWRELISRMGTPGEKPIVEKDRGISGRVLVVDICIPTPDQDSGSVTAFEFIRALIALGYKVTFLSKSGPNHKRKYTSDLQRIGVEVLYYPYCINFSSYLKRLPQSLDLAVIFRIDSAASFFKQIRETSPSTKIIFHTVDLHFISDESHDILKNDEKAFKISNQRRHQELHFVKNADCSVVVSEFERELLSKEAPDARVVNFPYVINAKPTRTEFQARQDMLFLGGFRHPPNVDAVIWFSKHILPLVKETLPDLKFFVIGSNPTDEVIQLASEDIIVTGYVDDLTPFFERVKLSVSPLRYGAGIKGKIVMSMSYGLPCVATSVAMEGMGLTHRKNVLVADDPVEFSKSIIEIYRDEALWRDISRSAVDFVRRNYSFENGLAITRRIISRCYET